MTHETRMMLARHGVEIEYTDYEPDGVVNLSRTEVMNEDLDALTHCDEFATLDLEFTAISDAGMAAIAEMPQLQKIELGDTLVSDAGLVNLSGLTKLERLGIGCDQG